MRKTSCEPFLHRVPARLFRTSVRIRKNPRRSTRARAAYRRSTDLSPAPDHLPPKQHAPNARRPRSSLRAPPDGGDQPPHPAHRVHLGTHVAGGRDRASLAPTRSDRPPGLTGVRRGWARSTHVFHRIPARNSWSGWTLSVIGNGSSSRQIRFGMRSSFTYRRFRGNFGVFLRFISVFSQFSYQFLAEIGSRRRMEAYKS